MSNGNIEFQCGTRCMHARFRERWGIDRKGLRKRAHQICFGLVLSFLLHNAIRKNVTNITDTISFFFSPSNLLCCCWTAEEKEKKRIAQGEKNHSFLPLFHACSTTRTILSKAYTFFWILCKSLQSISFSSCCFFPWLVLVFLCIQIWIGDAKQIVIVYEKKKFTLKVFLGFLFHRCVCVFFLFIPISERC